MVFIFVKFLVLNIMETYELEERIVAMEKVLKTLANTVDLQTKSFKMLAPGIDRVMKAVDDFSNLTSNHAEMILDLQEKNLETIKRVVKLDENSQLLWKTIKNIIDKINP